MTWLKRVKLKNLIKHIIKKFHTPQLRNTLSNDKMSHVKKVHSLQLRSGHEADKRLRAKVSTLQLRNNLTECKMSHVKKELEKRSTIAMLDEMGTRLRAKFKHVNKPLNKTNPWTNSSTSC